jgi:hypothetical protein
VDAKRTRPRRRTAHAVLLQDSLVMARVNTP